ncbi:MAG: OsmC family protein [Terriglobales bacterium]
MHREADAIWRDGPHVGKGTVSTLSGVLNNAHYVFGLAETSSCTTPGELLAAAIASSMSRMVALKMVGLGAKPAGVETHALIAFEDSGERWRMTAVHLEIKARAVDITSDCFEEAVQDAIRNCPITSQLNLAVEHTAQLEPPDASVAA